MREKETERESVCVCVCAAWQPQRPQRGESESNHRDIPSSLLSLSNVMAPPEDGINSASAPAPTPIPAASSRGRRRSHHACLTCRSVLLVPSLSTVLCLFHLLFGIHVFVCVLLFFLVTSHAFRSSFDRRYQFHAADCDTGGRRLAARAKSRLARAASGSSSLVPIPP